MIKLVPQIFIKQSLKARPVLSAEEYNHDRDGNGCKKYNEVLREGCSQFCPLSYMASQLRCFKL